MPSPLPHAQATIELALARRFTSTAMTHIAIAEMLTAKAIEWMEHVTDEQDGG